MGEQPTRGDAADRRDPGRPGRARPRASEPGASPVTVEQLIARQGGSVGRRAARRSEQSAAPQPARHSRAAPAAASVTPQRGLPPVPGAGPSVRTGLPPLPPLGRPGPTIDGPGGPRGPGGPEGPGGDGNGVRRSGPLPPLPGLRQPPPEVPAGRPRTPDRGPGRRAARRAAAGPARRRVVRAVIALLAVVGLVALYALGLYFYVDRTMDRVDALATDGPEVLAPQLQAGEQNYLVVGSHVPGEKGAASVAMLLASVSADGRHAVLLTLPPTTLVDTPECREPGGGLREPRTESLAASLLADAPACTVRAVQQLSGLRIDHYLDLDLSRLPGMVDALGGVAVCVEPSAAVAAASRPLPAGSSRLTGSQAAAYLRPANATADVTGTQAAQRAQLLLTSTLRAATSRSTLTSPVALTRFLTRAAGALTVDKGTTLGDLRGLGSGLGSGVAVQRAELPVAQVGYVPAGSKQSYVLLDQAGTRSLFDEVIGHTRLPSGYTGGAKPTAAGGDAGSGGAGDAVPSPAPAPAAPSSASGVSVAPQAVTVDVLNGTGTAGLAGTVATALRGQGFVVGTVGNAPAAVPQTVVRYGPDAQAQAQTVAAAVPGSVLQADPSAGAGVKLVIGPGYSSVVPVQVAPPAAASDGAPTSAAAAGKPAQAAAACG